jgi:general secretion pathway protein E
MTLPDLREAALAPLAQRLSSRYLDEHCLLPLGVDESGALATAVGGPVDETVTDELRRVYQRPIRLVEMPAGEIQAAILAARRDASTADGDAIAEVASGADGDEPLDDLRALASQAPVIKLVNVLMLDALRAGASDVHLESTAAGVRVRFRLDGVLHDVSELARQYQAAVISRVKIMAGLNIAERRLPQDGRARLRMGERDVDLRVATLPALHGESVVVRILDHGARARSLAEIGMPDDVRHAFEALVRRTGGIVLVTGPTGSGKTTTLYGAMSLINRPEVKIVTVEDPVEYRIDGVTQMPINRKAGLGFANALRSILRHDPDVIMVGEMRDGETAEIAIQAALTGHLVFSTLHTNDAPGGVTRLADMGIEPYLVAATVQGILAQRLVRLVCDRCAEPDTPSPSVLAGAPPRAPNAGPPRYRRGRGCAECTGTGFRGRTGIYELLVIDEAIRELIASRAPVAQLRDAARARGMVTLHDAGWRLVEAGRTTAEEIARVAGDGRS